MNTFTQFTRSGVLSVLVLFSGVAAQDLSDLDPTNPDSGLMRKFQTSLRVCRN